MNPSQTTNNQSDTESIWKALADPTRRKLMDLVRESPKTTGELVDEFDSIGRCAVMKHLSILENASLILPRKEGKYRWNYINAIPLQEIYERWVKKYEAQWATNLLQLKELAEHKSNIHQKTEDMIMEQEAKTIKILLEIPIKAEINQVWECLLKEIHLWWRKDFYTSSKTKKFIIEPKIGGRMYEDYGNDEGLLWATVIGLDGPNSIELKGHLSPQFGGPAMSFLKLSLKENGHSTVLTLSDTTFGAVSENTKKELTEGWKMIYEDGFKKYVEKKVA
ncbi:MAG: hypothetical protein DHS20C18_31990 [Saprospiraceae bacterium]|nr:MAG: hypothetical protein DHS20C18_31990 [Saprospiraceae bacterium]